MTYEVSATIPLKHFVKDVWVDLYKDWYGFLFVDPETFDIDFYTNYLTPAFILRDSSWSPGRTGKGWEKISSQGIGKPETMPNVGMNGGNMAAALDLVEAIEQPGRSFAIGIEWHPELSPGESVHEALFEALVEAARCTSSRNRR